jgi:antitoxin component of MazEF toxin-antitoxin module
MNIRKLQLMGGGESAGVALPKEDLRDLGLVEDGEIQQAFVKITREDDEFRISFVE